MFKFVLMTGVFLGSLAGMSGAVQAIESAAEPFHLAQVSAEKDKGEQSLGSAMAMTNYRVGDAVWVLYPNDARPGTILAVHAGRGTYAVRVYGQGVTWDDEVSPNQLRPRQ